MSDTLHEEPKKDNFEHESPLRAFTTFNSNGLYAIGKGFRPSLQHLPVYLDAMERKEGWRVVQVLEAGAQTPSFLFRMERPPMVTINYGGTEVSPEFKARIEEFLASAPAGTGFPGTKITLDQTPERIVRVPQALGAPYQAPPAWASQGSDEPIPEDRHEEATRFIAQSLDMLPDRAVADFRMYFVNGETKRWRESLFDRLHFLWPALDPVFLKARIDAYRVHAGREPVNHAYESRMAERRIEPDVPKDDPVNPKHYNGTGCAEIAENLPGNLAHAITYIWRAGDKPDQPELQEIDKALWWMDREMSRAKFLAFDDDRDDDKTPADMLKPNQDVFYVPTLHVFKRPNKKSARNVRNHPFWLFVAHRVAEARLTAWKASTVYSLAIYAIDGRTSALRSAINTVKRRRSQLDRLGEGPTPDMGRGQEP